MLFKKMIQTANDTLYQQGERFLQQQNYDQAMACFNQWLSAHPNDANAMYKMAFTLFITGRAQLALSAYQQSLVLAPGHPDILNGIGNCEQALGHMERAEECYNK